MKDNRQIFMASTCLALLLSFAVFWVLSLLVLGNISVDGGPKLTGILVIVFAALPTLGMIYLSLRAIKSRMLPTWFVLSFGTVAASFLGVGIYSTFLNMGNALWFGFPLLFCGMFLSLALWTYPIKG